MSSKASADGQLLRSQLSLLADAVPNLTPLTLTRALSQTLLLSGQ